MSENFEDRNHLEPELTWRDSATFIYDGVIEGKLNREDFIEFFSIAGEDLANPLHARVMGKALAAFFKRDYPNLRAGESPGVFIRIENRGFIVSHKDSQIVLSAANEIKEEDGSFLIAHESEADAKISAWESKEKYVQLL
jgi:hypothetical protein